jgi:hypothetical protein
MVVGRTKVGALVHSTVGNARPQGVFDGGHSAHVSDTPCVKLSWDGFRENGVPHGIGNLFEKMIQKLAWCLGMG